MRIILFGATGMVGQGVLRECLRDPHVTQVVSVARRTTGIVHAKLSERLHDDLFAWHPDDALMGYDACFFCLGVSAAGMGEETYTHMTFELTLSVARGLASHSPAMTFVYVSGQGSDASERGRVMWARVKGRTENALLALPFRAAYMFRPGVIQPVDGVRSGVWWYRVLYVVLGPFIPLLRRMFPAAIVTTAEVGQAMLTVARVGFARPVLESRDIGTVARAQARD